MPERRGRMYLVVVRFERLECAVHVARRLRERLGGKVAAGGVVGVVEEMEDSRGVGEQNAMEGWFALDDASGQDTRQREQREDREAEQWKDSEW